uniref:Uncharacterized protein n=1 Tax=Romanomermis culicivorax TaxID=13658 RepID=A0A915L2Q0_ROMCU
MIYVCDESNFLQNTICYRAVYEEDKDNCSFKCKDQKQHLLASFRTNIGTSSTTPSLSDYARLTADEVKFTCDYILCKSRCRSKELISKCGPEAETTLTTTYRYVIASVKSINKFTFDSLDAENSQKL